MQKFNLIHGGVFHVPANRLAALASDPEVAYVSPNRPLTSAADFSVTVAANVAQSYGLDGTGVSVVVIGSGSRYPVGAQPQPLKFLASPQS